MLAAELVADINTPGVSFDALMKTHDVLQGSPNPRLQLTGACALILASKEIKDPYADDLVAEADNELLALRELNTKNLEETSKITVPFRAEMYRQLIPQIRNPHAVWSPEERANVYLSATNSLSDLLSAVPRASGRNARELGNLLMEWVTLALTWRPETAPGTINVLPLAPVTQPDSSRLRIHVPRLRAHTATTTPQEKPQFWDIVTVPSAGKRAWKQRDPSMVVISANRHFGAVQNSDPNLRVRTAGHIIEREKIRPRKPNDSDMVNRLSSTVMVTIEQQINSKQN